MNPNEDRLINLAIHESSDPEMLRRDAESKTGSKPYEESSDPEMLRRDAESKTLDSFNHENEEDREHPLEPDFDITCEDKTAENQINIVNRPAG